MFDPPLQVCPMFDPCSESVTVANLFQRFFAQPIGGASQRVPFGVTLTVDDLAAYDRVLK